MGNRLAGFGWMGKTLTGLALLTLPFFSTAFADTGWSFDVPAMTPSATPTPETDQSDLNTVSTPSTGDDENQATPTPEADQDAATDDGDMVSTPAPSDEDSQVQPTPDEEEGDQQATPDPEAGSDDSTDLSDESVSRPVLRWQLTPTPTTTESASQASAEASETATDTPTPADASPTPTIIQGHLKSKDCYSAGLKAYREADYLKALKYWTLTLKLHDPDTPKFYLAEANAMMGIIYQFHIIDHEKAYGYYEAALAIDPTTQTALKHVREVKPEPTPGDDQ